MNRSIASLILLLFCFVPTAQGNADEKEKLPFDWAPRKEGWDWDEDDRFNELMEQLAINEASLEAVDAAIAKKTRRKGSQVGSARRYDENNRMMDRKGGGPMNWKEFYGTNAEKFFYHPVDPNTTYHTNTALRQMGKVEDDKSGADIPTRQSLPVHQRPPQWDYIYRANRSASESALADAALLTTEVEQLEHRRAQLEQEQAVLWCKLAFRAVQRLDVHRKPVLRFQLIAAGDGSEEIEQARALAAAAQFLAAALLIVEKAEESQSVAMGSANAVVVGARERFEDALLEQPSLESAAEDKSKPLGQFVALAKLLSDKSKTLSEAYAGAVDGAANNDATRKESYRGMLQRTVVDYSQILLALNELTDTLRKEWGVRWDPRTKVDGPQVGWAEPASVAAPTSVAASLPPASARTGPPASKVVDVLSLIARDSNPKRGLSDPPPNQVGQWILSGEGLEIVRGGGNSQLGLPLQAADSYRFSFTVERLEKGYGINIGLVVAGRRVMMVIDGSGQHKTCLERVNGLGIHDPANPTVQPLSLLSMNRATQVVCTVIQNSVTVECGGKQIISWKGAPTSLSVADQWAMPPEVGLSLGGQQRFRFTDVQYTAIQRPSSKAATSGGSIRPVSLIANSSLQGWHLATQSSPLNWDVKNGVLTCTAPGPFLVADMNADDFDLHVEFLLPSRCNTGLFLRGRYEVQLIDSEYGDLKPDQMCGAIYGQYPGRQNAYRGPQKWNSLDVETRGDRVSIKLNGELVVSDAVLSEPTGGVPQAIARGKSVLAIQSYEQKGNSVGASFRNCTVVLR